MGRRWLTQLKVLNIGVSPNVGVKLMETTFKFQLPSHSLQTITTARGGIVSYCRDLWTQTFDVCKHLLVKEANNKNLKLV